MDPAAGPRGVRRCFERLGHSALALQDTHKSGGVDYLATGGQGAQRGRAACGAR